MFWLWTRKNIFQSKINNWFLFAYIAREVLVIMKKKCLTFLQIFFVSKSNKSKDGCCFLMTIICCICASITSQIWPRGLPKRADGKVKTFLSKFNTIRWSIPCLKFSKWNYIFSYYSTFMSGKQAFFYCVFGIQKVWIFDFHRKITIYSQDIFIDSNKKSRYLLIWKLHFHTLIIFKNITVLFEIQISIKDKIIIYQVFIWF